jgi:hypothetical protein
MIMHNPETHAYCNACRYSEYVGQWRCYYKISAISVRCIGGTENYRAWRDCYEANPTGQCPYFETKPPMPYTPQMLGVEGYFEWSAQKQVWEKVTRLKPYEGHKKS